MSDKGKVSYDIFHNILFTVHRNGGTLTTVAEAGNSTKTNWRQTRLKK